jgi:hypothetical protein
VARGAVGEIDAGEFEQPVLGCFRFRFGDVRGSAEEIPAASEIILFGAAGEETGVTNAFEGGWDGMQEEAVNKFVRAQGHNFFPIVIATVAVRESDVTAGDIEDSMVGDGDAVGVAPEIIENDFRSGEGRFGVDDPIHFVERSDKRLKRVGVWDRETSFGVSGFEAAQEFAAEHERKRLDGK